MFQVAVRDRNAGLSGVFARLVVFRTVEPVVGKTQWSAGTEGLFEGRLFSRCPGVKAVFILCPVIAAGPGRVRNSTFCKLQGPEKGVLRTFCFETEGI
ncbi:MAG: hypothetical protein ACRESZ_05930 [Methylococcales bacterium]